MQRTALDDNFHLGVARIMKILVVDDEKPIVQAIIFNLEREGYEAIPAFDASDCQQLWQSEQPDLIILDLMLPSMSGFELCRRIRVRSNVPIIMLTARSGETDRVIGLELGADDYVVKPFSMRELMARVRAILRRPAASVSGQTLRVGNLTVDQGRHQVLVNGKEVFLAPKEFSLLAILAANPDRVFQRNILLDRAWGSSIYVEERTVDVHIRWLREKIEQDPSNPKLLITIRGVGYKLCSAPAE